MTMDDFKEILKISIHASRGGSDRCGKVVIHHIVISIHASRGGSDMLRLSFFVDTAFQSTLPAGEATA